MGKTGKMVRASVVEFASWDDVDRALKQIAEAEIGLETVEADMNVKINDAKAEADKLARPLKTTVEVLAAQLKAFMVANKAAFDAPNARSRESMFGTVGFRVGESISYPPAKTADVLQALKLYDMLDCIDAKETVNKTALGRHTDEEIEQVGARRVQKDTFFYEASRESVRA